MSAARSPNSSLSSRAVLKTPQVVTSKSIYSTPIRISADSIRFARTPLHQYTQALLRPGCDSGRLGSDGWRVEDLCYVGVVVAFAAHRARGDSIVPLARVSGPPRICRDLHRARNAPPGRFCASRCVSTGLMITTRWSLLLGA